MFVHGEGNQSIQGTKNIPNFVVLSHFGAVTRFFGSQWHEPNHHKAEMNLMTGAFTLNTSAKDRAQGIATGLRDK